MGVSYSVLALDAEVRQWLQGLGVECPGAESRNPTPADYERAIEQTSGVTVRFEVALGRRCAWVENYRGRDYGWTLVHLGPEQLDGKPARVWFEKGDPELVVAIVERLTHSCGPLALHSASGISKPIVISPGVDPHEALALWRVPPGVKI